MKRLTIFASLLLASFCGMAQEESADTTSKTFPINEGWAATVSLSPAFSAGDLSTAKGSDIGFIGGIGIQKAINPSLDWRFQFGIGSLKGSKGDSQYFKGNVQSLTTSFKFNYLTFINYEKFGESAITPYAFAGFGICSFKSERFNANNDASIEKQEERTKAIEIPLGLGVEYAINDQLSIGLEAGLNLLRTDALDAWESNTKAQRLDQGSNKTVWMLFGIKDSEDNLWQDMYGKISVSVKYNFDFSKSERLAPSSSNNLIK